MDEVTVLVVDDDFRVAQVHAAMVQRAPGYRVVGRASTASEAVALADELSPDLVLLDVYLPDRSGLEVVDRLRRAGRTDIILVTAARDADSVRQALNLGAQHYLIKPFRMADLLARLAAYRDLRLGVAALAPRTRQEDVDRLFGLRAGRLQPEAPGTANPTVRTILEIVRSCEDGVSAQQVATRMGISRATAQRYLAQLEGRGQVARVPRYGTPGRPENLYRLTAETSA